MSFRVTSPACNGAAAGPTGRPGRAPAASRTRLLENGIGLVESLEVTGPPAEQPRAESYSPDFQVCLPCAGAFVWHVGRDDVVADANQVLFVTGGEGYRVSQPVNGYAEMIVTVRPTLLAEMLGMPEKALSTHALFRHRSRPADRCLQRLGIEGLHRTSQEGWDELAGEEWLVDFLAASLAMPPGQPAASPSTLRLARRAKEYLAAHLSAPVRLADVARAVGTSPAYLTSVFSRLEGMPLHRYLVRLRLARALVELPHASDLTELALALGFSNHSHFTAAFHRTFGCTPSRFRQSVRREQADAANRLVSQAVAPT
ncbi:MAG: helix-turn-helix transcriptional regulator [Vicinamibacterales bacterium]